VLAAAGELGAERFDYAGWSMGALIGLRLLPDGADRVRSLALIDHAGRMDREAVEVVRAGLARLDVVAPSADDYVAGVRSAGAIDTWSDFWDAYYRYEVVETPAGWTPSTDRAACTEDLDALLDVPPAQLWRLITMPAVLIRARRRMGGGLIVPQSERDALVAAAPGVRVVETPEDHFTIMTAPATLDAIRATLAEAAP
jgi:pimeloyl-ACP methyl ester carboxylesterase